MGPAKNVAFAAARESTGTVLQIVATPDGYATIKRPLDVGRYRGKRILISTRGRLLEGNWRADDRIGVDVSLPGSPGSADRVRIDRLDGREWQDYRVVADVAADATGLDLVVTARETSKAQLDDITLTVIGKVGGGDESPRALTGRALDNVVAFARLYGIVRYFHPSDEAAALDAPDWERFVVRGVRAVESASGTAELASRLAELFAPIAPSVTVQPEGAPVPAVAAITGPAVHWLHEGVGLSKDSVYRSKRVGRDASFDASITTAIDPALVRGKRLKVVLRGRAILRGDGGHAGPSIAEYTAAGEKSVCTEPAMRPALGARWTTITVECEISSGAKYVEVGVKLIEDGEVWLESPVVTIDGKPIATPGWGAPRGELDASWGRSLLGQTVALTDSACERPHICLHVTGHPLPPLDLRPWHGALGGGVVATVPLELAMREGKTLAAAAAFPVSIDTMPLVVTDRATRLADIVMAWNILEHFSPYLDLSGTDWMAELRQRLADAARDDGAAAFQATLRHLLHDLHDGHGSVVHPGENTESFAPWRWERVEGRLAITQVAEQCACDLAPGDIVTAIDGEPTEHAIAAAGAILAAATEQHLRERVLRRLRRGAEGGHRTLTVERGGVAHQVTAALLPPGDDLVEQRPQSGEEVAPGIRYVNVDQVTEEQWNKILPDLATAQAVVCDMRGYPNNLSLGRPLEHFIAKPVSSPQWHVPMPTRPDREGMAFRQSQWGLRPVAPRIRNVVFLTDERAVSAAETFMGIVEGNKLGPIVGAPTAGTNGNINPFTLPGGYLIWWTGMKVLKQDGSRHHGVGILPTVPATRTLAGVGAQRDEVLEKGIAVAQQLAAGRPGK